MTTLPVNRILCGDCVEVLRKFPEDSIDLIYVDPPFFSNKKYEILWGDGYEKRAFEDRWKGGIQNYISWMKPKLFQCCRILKETGSIYLHCDYHANAYLRILMDSIFGEDNFRNEIIWRRSSGSGGKTVGSKYTSNHDTILFYTKTSYHVWNSIRYPVSNEEIINRYILEKNMKNVPIKKLVDKLRYNEVADFIDQLKSKMGNKLKYCSHYGRKEYKYLKDAGMWIDDVWSDIESISEGLRGRYERLGYPTQKPVALLERIIKASSNPTNIVLDPMCGCGTTIEASHKLGRRWIGIDISPTACKLMVKRMRRRLHFNISEKDIIGLPQTLKEIEAMTPFEFQNWVVQRLNGRVSRKKIGDMGIDGFTLDMQPIQVKQRENVGRNIVDNFETAMRRAKAKKGIIVAFSFGKGAWEERARAEQEEELHIVFKTVEELLGAYQLNYKRIVKQP